MNIYTQSCFMILLFCFLIQSYLVLGIHIIEDVNRMYNQEYLFAKDLNCSSIVQDIPELDNDDIRRAVQEYMYDPNSSEEMYGKIEYWNVQKVTNMFELFAWYQNTTTFNADLSCWNVSSVTDMTYMFAYASEFNGNINNWDTINVLYMTGMFRYATAFNAAISDWNLESTWDTWGMFYGAQSFNQELCWNISGVYNTGMMFYNSSGCIDPSCCDEEGCDEELLCTTNSNRYKVQ